MRCERGISRNGFNTARNAKKLSQIGGIFGIVATVCTFGLISCTPSESTNSFDNGTYVAGNGSEYVYSDKQVRETPIRVSLRETPDQETAVQSTKLYKDEDGQWKINLAWRPEYQNKVDDLDIQMKGDAPTEIVESDTVTNVQIMVQGYHKYDDKSGDATGVSHNGMGWVETDDETDELLNVMITERDLVSVRLRFKFVFTADSAGLKGKIDFTAIADTINGAKVIQGTKYPDLPADSGKVGEPFVPNMDLWRPMNNPATLPIYEGVFNPATGQYEYDYTKEPLVGELYINKEAKGNEVKNGNQMMIKLSNGKFTLIDIPEAGQNIGKGDNVSYYPYFTDHNGNTEVYTDDFNAIPEPRYTGEKATTYGNYSFAPYSLKPDDMSVRTSYYQSEYTHLNEYGYILKSPDPLPEVQMRYEKRFASENREISKKATMSILKDNKKIGDKMDIWLNTGLFHLGYKINSFPALNNNNTLRLNVDNLADETVFYDSIPYNLNGEFGYEVLELKSIPTIPPVEPDPEIGIPDIDDDIDF